MSKAVLAAVALASIGIGAQSCETFSPVVAGLSPWYSGWLDENTYIYFQVLTTQDITVYLEFSGYKARPTIDIIVLPTEDFGRWKNGKPARIISSISSDDTHNFVGLYTYTGYGAYTIIVRNRWIWDFESQDCYVKVYGSYK